MAKSDDPFDAFGKMLSQWETMSNEMANKVMATGEFGKTMGGATTMGLGIREAIHDAMTKVLETGNMPTRDDVTELTRRVAAMDERLQRIERSLAKISGEAPPPRTAARPPRTKRPPPRADGR